MLYGSWLAHIEYQHIYHGEGGQSVPRERLPCCWEIILAWLCGPYIQIRDNKRFIDTPESAGIIDRLFQLLAVHMNLFGEQVVDQSIKRIEYVSTHWWFTRSMHERHINLKTFLFDGVEGDGMHFD